MRNTQIFPIGFINVFSMVRLIEYNSYYSDHINASGFVSWEPMTCHSQVGYLLVVLRTTNGNSFLMISCFGLILEKIIRNTKIILTNFVTEFILYTFIVHSTDLAVEAREVFFIINVNYIICKKGDPIIVLAWRS